nr:hypothetical protein [uncultured Lichenicoccus sp.]
MPATVLLNAATWDLELDVNGNIALTFGATGTSQGGYALAQDAASAIKTFQGEAYYDTTLGVPYFTNIFADTPSLTTLKSLFTTAALAVPGVVHAQCFITSIAGRVCAGQVQITDEAGVLTPANF